MMPTLFSVCLTKPKRTENQIFSKFYCATRCALCCAVLCSVVNFVVQSYLRAKDKFHIVINPICPNLNP